MLELRLLVGQERKVKCDILFFMQANHVVQRLGYPQLLVEFDGFRMNDLSTSQ